MGFLGRIFGKQNSLKKLKLEELKREQIRLTQEERKLVNKFDDLEGQKKALFDQGLKEGSEAKRRILAREYKTLDSRVKHFENNLKFFSKQIRIINGLVSVKENERIFEQMGVSKLINNMDLAELQAYVEEASTEGEFRMDKFTSILEVMEEQEKILTDHQDEKDIEEIMDTWRDMESMGATEGDMADDMTESAKDFEKKLKE
jgi:hypothetical protein